MFVDSLGVSRRGSFGWRRVILSAGSPDQTWSTLQRGAALETA